MMARSLMMPVVYINFKLNQDSIAKVLCINKDKPQLKCNGSCVLMKKINEAQDTEQSQENRTNKQQVQETFCESLFDFNSLRHFYEKEGFVAYETLFFSHFPADIFHPPKG